MNRFPFAKQARSAPLSKPVLSDLFSDKTLALMRDSLGKMAGLSLIVLDGTGKTLLETASMASLCRSLRRDKAYGPLCATANQYGLDMACSERGHFFYHCPCGLIRAVIPVFAGNRCLGAFFIGHVRSANAPENTPDLKRLQKPDHTAALLKPHIRDALTATPAYDFSYFAYIAATFDAVVTEAAARETARLEREETASAELAAWQKKAAVLEQELAVRENSLVQWRSQINLDFFINALSSLSGLAATEDSPKTQELCLLLAEHLRRRLTGETGFIPLREEMRAVETYLAVQRARFGEGFRYEISLPGDLARRPFPAQTLLPFVEAAVLRGLALTENGYALSLVVTREKDEIELLLRDNAPDGMELCEPGLAAFPGGEAADAARTAAALRFETLLGGQHDVRFSASAQGSVCRIRYTPPIGEEAHGV